MRTRTSSARIRSARAVAIVGPALSVALTAPLALGAALALTGCAEERAPPPPPPPAQAEVRPLPPVSAETLVWQPGHWSWSGSTYVWDQGRYVTAAGHGTRWADGYWARTPSGWAWQPAHWM